MTSSKRSKTERKATKRPTKDSPPAVVKPAPLKKAGPEVEQTILWMLKGTRTRDIVEALALEFPKCDPAKTIDAALDHFEVTADAHTDTLRGWCLEAYRELYRRMVEIGDFPAAVRVVDKLLQYALRYPSEKEEGLGVGD